MTDEDARDMHALALGTARDTPFAQEERLYGAALARALMAALRASSEHVYDISPAPPAASGWRLVPVEPTEEMLKAAAKEEQRCAIHNYGAPPHADDLWSVMLAAAPPPPVPAQAESGDAWEMAIVNADKFAERIRELEGENAGLRELYDGNTKFLAALAKGESERAERLTRAAETARDALLKIDSLNDNPRVFNGDINEVVVEALATLSAALPREGGKE